MEQNVPRRLARFYRSQNAPQQQQDSYSLNESQEGQSQKEHIHNKKGEQDNYLEEPKGLPTMDYSDVNLEADKKNVDELQKIQQKNLVEKLALEEITKFKTQNNRMPNSKEEEQIAENLFKQLKDEPSDSTHESGSRRANRRAGRETENKGANNITQQNEPSSTSEEPISQTTNVKDLFTDEENINQGKEKDEFDMGLGDINESDSENAKETDDIEDLEETDLEDKKICPNCKKQTEKIVYCSKCGTAFCSNCAKVVGTDKVCPKCQTKIKF